MVSASLQFHAALVRIDFRTTRNGLQCSLICCQLAVGEAGGIYDSVQRVLTLQYSTGATRSRNRQGLRGVKF